MADSTTQNMIQFTTEDLQRLIIQPLEKASVVEAAGPNFVDSPQGVPVRFSKIASQGEASWVGEGGAIGAADPTPGEVILLPETLGSVKAMHKMSNEFIRHSPHAMLSAMSNALTRKTGKALDDAFLTGDGSQIGATGYFKPVGLRNISGVQTQAFSVNPTTVAEMLDPIDDAISKLVEVELTDMSKWTFFVSPQAWKNWSKMKDADNRPLLQPDPTSAAVRRVKGIPVVPTSKLAAGEGLLVDMSEVIVARDLNPQVKILDQTYAANDQTAIRLVARADIDVFHASAIVKLDDASP
jgi:HK97 family phage major capsid protein